MDERDPDVTFAEDFARGEVMVGETCIAQHPRSLVDCRWKVLDVLDDLVAYDDVEETVVER